MVRCWRKLMYILASHTCIYSYSMKVKLSNFSVYSLTLFILWRGLCRSINAAGNSPARKGCWYVFIGRKWQVQAHYSSSLFKRILRGSSWASESASRITCAWVISTAWLLSMLLHSFSTHTHQKCENTFPWLYSLPTHPAFTRLVLKIHRRNEGEG